METPQGTSQDGATTATSVHRSAWQPSWEKNGRKGGPRARSSWLGWLVVFLILLALFVPIGFLIVRVTQNVAVYNVAKQFCADEVTGKYSDAYNLLSQRAQQSISPTAFSAASDEAHIVSCYPAQSGLSLIPTGSSITLLVTYAVLASAQSSSAVSQTGTMRLVYEGGGWRVDAVTTSLFTLF